MRDPWEWDGKGAQLWCPVCNENVYDDILMLANHTIEMLPDGRNRWTSRDFDIVVHECDPKFGIVALAESIVREAI